MAEAETLESKRKVDESLNTVIEQSGTLVCRNSFIILHLHDFFVQVLPFIAVITEPIPQLCEHMALD